MNLPTTSGAITIRTAEGVTIGHGRGEVRMGRDPDTGRACALGEIREITWSTDLPLPDPGRSYRVVFHGGPSFIGVFGPAFPDASQRRATFRPRAATVVPTGSDRTPSPTRFSARLV